MKIYGFGRHLPTSCSACRFWQADEPLEEPVLGECRVHAPEFNPLPGDPADPDTQASLPRRPWPMTESIDWCAAWRRARGRIQCPHPTED
jgi:hypothetical protein